MSSAKLSRRALFSALAPRRHTNIVFVLADDLGYGDLGCYGGPYPTPRIDQLAREGVRFTQYYAASPICSPSRVGITTGQFPARHRIHSYLNDRASNRERGMADFLDPRAPLVARAFKNAGYATAHFGKWHMGGGRDVDDAPHPSAYGFDESLTSFEGLGDRVLPPGRLSELSARLGQGKISYAPKHELTGIYVDRAISFIERNARRPFYLHVWLDDPHDPFEPKEELLAKHRGVSQNKYEQQYYAVLDEMDRQVGRLADAIDRAGLSGDTLLVFASDNGPTAWPRYYKEGLPPPGRTAGLRGRKWSLYEGGIRAPLIVRCPGRTPAGKIIRDTVACGVDLFPTFCGLAGIQPPEAAFDGENLMAALLGREQRRRSPLFWEYPRSAKDLRPGLESDQSPTLAIRDGRWKLLMNAGGGGMELYSFERGFGETLNEAGERPAVARRLSERLLGWRRSANIADA